MNKKLKKEIFILIIQCLFNDKSDEINFNNCIPFYHFLINTLEIEIYDIPKKKINEISLCHSITELLCNFDLMDVEFSFWNSENIKSYLKNHS